MAEDIKVGDRVRVDGTIPHTPFRVSGAYGEVGGVDHRSAIGPFVVLDEPPNGHDDRGWFFLAHQLTKVAPDGDSRSAPLAILARAADECLQYHVPPEAADGRGLDGITGSLSVGALRDLVRQGKREGVI